MHAFTSCVCTLENKKSERSRRGEKVLKGHVKPVSHIKETKKNAFAFYLCAASMLGSELHKLLACERGWLGDLECNGQVFSLSHSVSFVCLHLHTRLFIIASSSFIIITLMQRRIDPRSKSWQKKNIRGILLKLTRQARIFFFLCLSAAQQLEHHLRTGFSPLL